MYKFNNRNSRKRCGICSKLRHKNTKLWTYLTPCSSVSEHVIAGWEKPPFRFAIQKSRRLHSPYITADVTVIETSQVQWKLLENTSTSKQLCWKCFSGKSLKVLRPILLSTKILRVSNTRNTACSFANDKLLNTFIFWCCCFLKT